MRALVAGVCGFTGSRLARYLLDQGDEVWGLARPGASRARLSVAGADVPLLDADLTDPAATRAAVIEAAPDVVFHLAGLTGRAPLSDLLQANAVSTDNLLSAAERSQTGPRMMLVSSAAVYGAVPAREQPISEDRPLAPVTPYGISKAAAELVAMAWWRNTGVEVVIVRPFNIIGHDATPETLIGAVQGQLAAIRAGARPPVLELGSLDAQRDWVDVEFAVAAYRTAALKGEAGTAYNVCTGNARPVRDIVDELIAASGVAGVEIATDPERLRSADVDMSVGDPSRLLALEGIA